MSVKTLNNLKSLLDWAYTHLKYDCGFRLSSMLNYTKAEGASDVQAYPLFGVMGHKQEGSHKDFGETIRYVNKYNEKGELIPAKSQMYADLRPGDWVAYDVKNVKDNFPHFAWYLGKDRKGNHVFFESVGGLHPNDTGATKYYISDTKYSNTPIGLGPRDTLRVQTAADIKEDEGYVKIANSVVNTFGADSAIAYVRLPSLYDLTDEEWKELIDYLYRLRDLNKKPNRYSTKPFTKDKPKSVSDISIFNIENDIQGPIYNIDKTSGNVAYHYPDRKIVINIEHNSGGM